MIGIEDTYAEAFESLVMRLLITARDERQLSRAASRSTSTPAIVIGRTEGGVERILGEDETPDGRVGAIVQFHGLVDPRRPLEESRLRFVREVSYRIRQDILCTPTTRVFNALDTREKVDIMDWVGRCGDGYEWETKGHGREMIHVPLMMPGFEIERYLGCGVGVSGGNIWLFCEDEDTALEAGERAVGAIQRVEGVITPFHICPAGSKPETKYEWIGPTTNHIYCPELRGKIANSKVPENVGSIPEIVIDGINLEAVKRGMLSGMRSVKGVDGVIKISAGNYGGKLGRHRISLKELVPELVL